ncbi:hypothetical protein ACJROX_03865 [Pseudalkalibacillus sp. A8]|uniref:hypothetical protein n=1 Tax=Pseudalkalibacillus sp. A8 TaxID=3382641 RepID=UPI0038B6783B
MKLLAGYIVIISLLNSSFMLTEQVWGEIKSVEPPSKMIESEMPIDSTQLARSSTSLLMMALS